MNIDSGHISKTINSAVEALIKVEELQELINNSNKWTDGEHNQGKHVS